jgi:hypothetical protein
LQEATNLQSLIPFQFDFSVVPSGHGEWENDLKTRCRILWRKPEQLASDIYSWADANGYINAVCTIYELHSGKYEAILIQSQSGIVSAIVKKLTHYHTKIIF